MVQRTKKVPLDINRPDAVAVEIASKRKPDSTASSFRTHGSKQPEALVNENEDLKEQILKLTRLLTEALAKRIDRGT